MLNNVNLKDFLTMSKCMNADKSVSFRKYKLYDVMTQCCSHRHFHQLSEQKIKNNLIKIIKNEYLMYNAIYGEYCII